MIAQVAQWPLIIFSSLRRYYPDQVVGDFLISKGYNLSLCFSR